MRLRDEQVIEAIRNRDEAVMAQVMNRYARLLWSAAGSVLGRTGSEQDIEECVADAFILLWQHPERYDPRRGKLKTWLALIARTNGINRWREQKRQGTVSLEEAALAQERGMEEQLEQAETGRALEAAMEELGEPEREIMIRRYHYGQKPREIAKSLHLEVRQVDNYLYRTKRKLRSMPEQE